jgi:hypothetical protein
VEFFALRLSFLLVRWHQQTRFAEPKDARKKKKATRSDRFLSQINAEKGAATGIGT